MLLTRLKIGSKKFNLAAMDSFIVPGLKLTVRSMNAPSGRDISSVVVKSEVEGQTVVATLFENASHRNCTFHE